MRRRLFGMMLAAGLLFAACNNGDPAVDLPDLPDDPMPGVTSTVETADTDLGTVLVTGDGMTLYMFANDTDGVSQCYDQCAQTWPPLIEAVPTAGEGADGDLLGTHEREDGSQQVTYNNHPLYRYNADTQAGDTNGQGVGGNWWVLSPAGEPIE